jgi:hypothetical protein
MGAVLLHQRHDGQHDFQVVDEPVGRLRLDQVLGREQRERGMDDGDLARDFRRSQG